MGLFAPQNSCTTWAATAVVALVLLSTVAWVDLAKAASRRELAGRSSSSLAAELMVNLKSPLSNSQASAYGELFKRTGSVGDLCQSGHLYCDAQTYQSYYEGLLRLDEHVEDKDIPVFFRESELTLGRETTIADPRLQDAALERNRQAIANNAIGQMKYTYLNVGKVPARAFLPDELSRTLPFTSTSASDIFLVDKSTALARQSSETVQICEEGVQKDGSTDLQGEAAACATSLEGLQSLLSSSKLLGPHDAENAEALTSDAGNLRGQFTGKVMEVKLKASETSRHAVCHNLMYPSAVYFCHYLPGTRVYAVTLQETDATAASNRGVLQAVAMCHLDTNGWSPRHLAFQNLGTQPGQAEACHWVLQGSLTFVPAN